MIERILAFSVRNRWLVLLLTLAAAAWGLWSLDQATDRPRSRHYDI